MTPVLYNTLKRQKQPLETLEPNQVKLYCCGVTVYDYCHLGHARSYISWDTLRRYLLWQGYQVRYVQNFTDIDDKILNRARERGTTMEQISEQYTQAYFEDMARLNILEADEYPRATHTLDGIKDLIQKLEQKGLAYAADGDVYYSVRKFPDYGKLSGRKLDDLQAGASGRVDADPEAKKKQDAFDFALWKGAKPGEPAWDSPWGKGRPGWHIECSAMIRARLGEAIDIHMGGGDLVFPHHENEIAQSEAVTGQPLARYWLHNGMVNVDGNKMSKSLGNFTTIRQLLDQGGVDPMVLRLFVLQAQYRKPLDFTEAAIDSARNGWATLTEGLRFGWQYGQQLGWGDLPDSPFNLVPPLDQLRNQLETLPWGTGLEMGAIDQFNQAMDDDLNTPSGLAVLFELAKALRKVGNVLSHGGTAPEDTALLQRQWYTLWILVQVLGFVVPADLAQAEAAADDAHGLSDGEVEAVIAQRIEARKSKNWAEADRLRDLLQEAQITVIDQPDGTSRWRR
jgi:cysteinyl-tRNA synthetase